MPPSPWPHPPLYLQTVHGGGRGAAGRAADGTIYLYMWSVPTSCRRSCQWAATYSVEFVKQRRLLLLALFLAETIAFSMGVSEQSWPTFCWKPRKGFRQADIWKGELPKWSLPIFRVSGVGMAIHPPWTTDGMSTHLPTWLPTLDSGRADHHCHGFPFWRQCSLILTLEPMIFKFLFKKTLFRRYTHEQLLRFLSPKKIFSILLYFSIFFFKFFSHLGSYRILSRVPCAIQ